MTNIDIESSERESRLSMNRLSLVKYVPSITYQRSSSSFSSSRKPAYLELLRPPMQFLSLLSVVRKLGREFTKQGPKSVELLVRVHVLVRHHRGGLLLDDKSPGIEEIVADGRLVSRRGLRGRGRGGVGVAFGWEGFVVGGKESCGWGVIADQQGFLDN